MKILGLPGIKPATEQWMQQLLDSLNLGQSNTIVQKYQCWSTPESGLDMELEAGTASRTKPDIVVAKSVGTRVALFAYSKGLLTADKYIFLGMPVRNISNDEISALKKLCDSNRALLIQQTNDPVGGCSELASILPESDSCRPIEIPGNDHLYDNIRQLKQIIESEI